MHLPNHWYMSMQNLRTADEDSGANAASDAVHRIGAVSRLTGVPVTTLRVWETRHAAFTPAKTEGKHRLYTDTDVIKARLLRQLASAGHGIGSIAQLAIEPLQRMLAAAREAEPLAAGGKVVASRRVTALVVGEGIAARVHAPGWRERHFGAALQVRRVFVDLEEAANADASAQPAEGDTAILLVRLHALNARSYEQLSAAIERLRVERVVVLYNFAPEALVATLRAAGILARREPVPDTELADLIRSVVMVDAGEAVAAFRAGALIPRRRYSDATLARVAASPNNVVCECPRHIADLIGQLSAFEQYSEDCLNDTAEDARLHAYLRSVAGSARALFEHALQMAAQHGGITLEEDAPAPETAVAAPQHGSDGPGAQ
jgi:DNA-binding transcriptional MerR regulator